MLMDWGFDAYVMDWGVADELDSPNTLETYMGHYLPQALKAVAEVSGYDNVHFLTYCMGGAMLVHGLAGKVPVSARSVVTIAAPFDLRHLGATFDAIREGKIKPEDLLDDTGNVPGPLLVKSFKRRKPTYALVAGANLWENLWNEQYLEGYQAIGRYLSSYPPLAGALLRQRPRSSTCAVRSALAGGFSGRSHQVSRGQARRPDRQYVHVFDVGTRARP